MKFRNLLSASMLCTAACSATPATVTPSAESRVEAPSGDPRVEAPSGDSRDGETLGWALSDVKVLFKRNHHVTFVAQTAAGPSLYVFGGVNANTVIPIVERMDIREDGSLSPPRRERSMTDPRGGLTGGIVQNALNGQNVVVLAGGNAPGGVRNSSVYATIGDDGSLGEWRDGGSVGHARMHPAAFVRGDSIYVMGGFEHPNVWNDVVRATVAADGTLSEWKPAGNLIGARSHFSVSTVDDYVFVIGGLDTSPYVNPPALTEVSRGRVLPDGTLGDWTLMSPLPVAISTHASLVHNGYVYAGGGIHMAPTAAQEKRMWRARIAADHTLGAWEEVQGLPAPRGHVHQFPTWGSNVYSVAGAIDFALNSTDAIAVGTFR